MAITFQQFDAEYRALTGHDGACRWQYRLYCEFAEGIFPTDIELGTGLGKTSVIALWVLAFGRVISKSPCAVPRRLVFVVDRRVVVDQASEFAEEIRLRLEAAESDSSHVLHVIASNLRGAGCGNAVLETSTLRGQRTLDTRWRNDPSQPAVLVGTVDMIGSRLLFSGYGRLGPWAKPFEAGLIGQDCLLVLDEAHLCAPFASTLAAIERRTSRHAPLRLIRMGATMAPATDMLSRTPGLFVSGGDASDGSVDARKPFRLLPEEMHEDKVRERLNAAKSGVLAEITTNAAEQLATWAVGILADEPSSAIGIVVNTVVEARRCVKQLTDQLAKAKMPLGNVDFVSITGSMRGFDRDALVKSDAYQRFRSQRDRSINHDRPAFLIATSCIEVGADIDCDHLGTESCSADSLIQRLGRVNRLGKRKDSPSRVFVVGKREDTPAGYVFAKLDRLSKAIQRLRARNRIENSVAELVFNSGELMTRLLGKCNSKKSLFQVHVPPPALTDAVLDDFALTSKYPDEGARPDVGRWLHGSIEEASLYVGLAWRLELDHVTLAQVAERLLDAFPISPRETARCPLYEAIDVIAAICKRNPENPGFIVVCRNGENVAHSLRSHPIDKDELRALLFDALIVLPSSVGGYDGRFVDPASSATVDDIAEAKNVQPPTRALRRRLRVKSGRVFLATNDAVPLGEVGAIRVMRPFYD